ncbi:MAG TPA: DUF2249 domain-containing protein [Stellaceae bacterium]|nr:DUF2249 domain-containing protein [Stellaceae bacterium]
MSVTTEEDPLPRLNRLLIDALGVLAKLGDADRACRIAADAYALLRRRSPEEAARLNSALHHFVRLLPRLEHNNQEDLAMAEIATLDVRALPPARRHSLIFETYAGLPPQGAFVLVNDHDPMPLYYQFQAERPGEVDWEYLERGPQVWRVRIGRQPRTG